ncbi:MAG: tetratricopeptide repeat protein [Duncaniella sp.]|nr:tetratricopeptide repeat protein [Duncaniella sp.]
MKKILIFFLLMTPFITGAQTLFEQADSAYTAEDYAAAAQLYSRIAETDGTSAPLLYNLGNCYYRMGRNGMAVLMYERALRIDPSMSEARENLAFVNSRLTDRPGERGTFLGNMLDSVSGNQSSDFWAWIAAALFLITITGIVLYIFSSSIPLRKTGFFGGLISLALCAVAVFFSLRNASAATDTEKAVILAPSTILSTAPRIPADRSLEAMLLHEVTRV